MSHCCQGGVSTSNVAGDRPSKQRATIGRLCRTGDGALQSCCGVLTPTLHLLLHLGLFPPVGLGSSVERLADGHARVSRAAEASTVASSQGQDAARAASRLVSLVCVLHVVGSYVSLHGTLLHVRRLLQVREATGLSHGSFRFYETCGRDNRTPIWRIH